MVPARRVGLSIVVLGLAAPAVAAAQSYEAPPPIAVPTGEVKQDTNPVPQGAQPAPKPPPPKAAPKPAEVAPPKTSSAAPASDKKDEGEKPPPKYDNEGVFKLSGTKGSTATTLAKKTTKAKAAKDVPVAEWPGFRMLEGGASEVIVEFSKEPSAPTEHRAAGSITYVFKGAQVARANNKNPLITVHFDTPVSSARLVNKKGELHLVISLRPGVDVAPTTGVRAPGDGAGKQFFVKFPSGSWLPQAVGEEPVPTQKLKLEGQPAEPKPPEPAKPEEKKPANGGSKTGPQQ